MHFNGLGHYLEELKRRDELVEINERVDPVLEVAEICDRLVKSGGPAVLFRNVAGCSIPLAMNLFGTEKRMAFSLGAGSFEEIAARIENIIKAPLPGGFFDKLSHLPRLLEVSNAMPRVVSRGAAPCKNTVVRGGDIDLGAFPIIKCWPGDGGRFITLPLVFTKNPDTGVQNCGMYRMQVLGRNETAMHWHKHKDGAYIAALHRRNGSAKVPVSVAIGADPAVIFAATAPMPNGVDEMMLAGFIRNKPVNMVKSELSDILVPADAEIVLEGEVDLTDLRDEGPFGDHTGYYTPVDKYPAFKIGCITMREKPVFSSTIVGIPPMEDYFMGRATERIFLPLIKMMCPEIIDMDFPMAGVFHNLVLVRIKKLYHGHPQKIMSWIWGQNQMMFTKNVVVFDEDTDIHDHQKALFTMLANVDFRRDVTVFDGPVDVLDHASTVEGFGPKVGIDATAKTGGQPSCRPWPAPLRMPEGIQKAVDEKWSKYGLK